MTRSIFLILPVYIGLLAATLLSSALFGLNPLPYSRLASIVILIIVVMITLTNEHYWEINKVVLTDGKVLVDNRVGLLYNNETELELSKISEVKVAKNVLLPYGTVTVYSAIEGSDIPFEFIKSPHKVAEELKDLIEKARGEQC